MASCWVRWVKRCRTFSIIPKREQTLRSANEFSSSLVSVCDVISAGTGGSKNENRVASDFVGTSVEKMKLFLFPYSFIFFYMNITLETEVIFNFQIGTWGARSTAIYSLPKFFSWHIFQNSVRFPFFFPLQTPPTLSADDVMRIYYYN